MTQPTPLTLAELDRIIAARLAQSSLNSPDNLPSSARRMHADQAYSHSAPAIGSPKMPGEPMRVQPSRKRRLPDDEPD